MDQDPPLPKSLTSDPTSFAYTSARTRWPAIITSAIDDVHRTISCFSPIQEENVPEGKKLISSLASLKYELQHNRALTPISDDGEPDVKLYNDELSARAAVEQDKGEAKDLKWHDVEWLYAECYLYRRISSLFKTSLSPFWKDHDCFSLQKRSTFRSSRSAVVELASRYRNVITQLQESGSIVKGNNGSASKEEEAAEKLLFTEMAEICLWGNATDLSLLTHLTYEDIQKLQGAQARKASESKILVNDLSLAFDVLNTAKREGRESRRIDIVLDNAGFELFVDLVLAGYLLQTGLASEVVLHPKNIPWFVSDVVPRDLAGLLDVLRDPRGFYENSNETDSDGREVVRLEELETSNLQFLFEHWSTLHEEGKLILRPNGFWTHPGSFWRMPSVQPGLVEDLRESELVIFKGDLNYRKLVGDALWPPTKPFAEAIGPLGPGSGIRVLALRTCKADVVVGLPEGKDEEIKAMEDDADGGTTANEAGGSAAAGANTEKKEAGMRKWAWSGKWAVVQFCDGKA